MGAYAAVIPRWVAAMLRNEEIVIHGDGQTSWDFCYVDNVVQANLRAALIDPPGSCEVYNVAVGERTALECLFRIIREKLSALGHVYTPVPVHKAFREGDVLHSLADISKAREQLRYAPSHDLPTGIANALPWYIEHFSRA
jgi:UDP-N-acetylglucosamine 4-epimerase